MQLYPRRKELKYPLITRLGFSLNRSGSFGEGKNAFPLPGFESRLVQRLTQSLYWLSCPRFLSFWVNSLNFQDVRQRPRHGQLRHFGNFIAKLFVLCTCLFAKFAFACFHLCCTQLFWDQNSSKVCFMHTAPDWNDSWLPLQEAMPCKFLSFFPCDVLIYSDATLANQDAQFYDT